MSDGESISLEPAWVVRDGITTPAQLRNGTAQHRAVPDLVGFSVQHQPGRTIEQHAEAGQFRHARISIATADQLVATASTIGYNVHIVPRPGKGFRHTVETPHPLPDDLALVLSNALQKRPNPARSSG